MNMEKYNHTRSQLKPNNTNTKHPLSIVNTPPQAEAQMSCMPTFFKTENCYILSEDIGKLIFNLHIWCTKLGLNAVCPQQSTQQSLYVLSDDVVLHYEQHQQRPQYHGTIRQHLYYHILTLLAISSAIMFGILQRPLL